MTQGKLIWINLRRLSLNVKDSMWWIPTQIGFPNPTCAGLQQHSTCFLSKAMGTSTRIEQVEQCIRQLPQEMGENPHTEDKPCCILLAAYLTPLPEWKEQVNSEYNHRISISVKQWIVFLYKHVPTIVFCILSGNCA